MNALQIVAVDDEYLALDLLQQYVEQTPGIELQGRFQSAVAALEVIRTQPPDILLLDIQMPGLSGLNLLRSLPRPPVTIFTTAYPDYALDAYDLDVVDYLLKPFPFERFLRAVNKARDLLQPQTAGQPQIAPASAADDAIVVKVDGRLTRILLKDIIYIEGLKEYLRIHTDEGRFIILERMHQMEERLPESRFVRIHKSYLVAVERVKALEGNQLDMGGTLLPVSRQRKEAVVRLVFGE